MEGAAPDGAIAADPGVDQKGGSSLEKSELWKRRAVPFGPGMSSGFSSRETSSSLGSALAMVFGSIAPPVIAEIGNVLVGPIAGFSDG